MMPPSDEFVRRVGPPRPTRRFGRSRQFLLGIVVVVILGIAGRFTIPVAYGWIKVGRARKAAGTAERLMEANDLPEAARFSRVAYELSPNDPDVLRTVARLGLRLGRPECVGYFIAYRATGRMTPGEKIAMAEAAVRFGRPDVARPVLAELLETNPADRQVWRLAVAHARQEGNLPSAIALARRTTEKFVGDVEAEFDLANLLLASGRSAMVAQGRGILWGLALGRTAMEQPAAMTLAQLSDLKASEAETLARVLESSPTNRLSRSLVGLQLRIRANPARKEEFLAKAARLVPTNGPVSEVCELVLWLTDRQGISHAAAHLPEARCRTNLPLLAARLDYLVAMDDSAGLEATVADRENVLDSGMRSAARGALAAKLGKKEEAERAFRSALDASGSRLVLVAPFVAREAERYRMNSIAVQALQIWMESPGVAMTAARRILRLLGEEPDPVQALETLRRLHAKVPGEESVLLERAWQELVAGENLVWAWDELKRISASRPEDAGIRFALAFAEWRNGKASQGLATLESRPLDPEKLSLRQRVVYAVLLGANDQREAARRIVRGIPDSPRAKAYESLIAPWR